MAARQRGAKAMLVVTGPRSPNAGETVPMTFDTALAGSGHRRREHQRRRWRRDRSRAAPGKTLAGRAEGARLRQPARRRLRAPGRRRHRARRRSCARSGPATTSSRYLPATAPAQPVPKPWVALGAHYDHLGRGETATRWRERGSRARSTTAPTTTPRARRRCWPSARRSSKQPRRRNVMLDFWSGEELGLLGSAAFVDEAAGAARPDRRVSQLRHGRPHAGQQAHRAGDRHEPGRGRRLIEQANIAAGFDLQLQADPVSADRRRELQPGRACPA